MHYGRPVCGLLEVIDGDAINDHVPLVGVVTGGDGGDLSGGHDHTGGDRDGGERGDGGDLGWCYDRASRNRGSG